jgi:2',3'-cyclic-nucleotide 2'-phosphodiesterase/3'-nucleotidase
MLSPWWGWRLSMSSFADSWRDRCNGFTPPRFIGTLWAATMQPRSQTIWAGPMTFISRRAVLLSGAALPLALFHVAAAQAQVSARLRLRLLETTDLHVNVYPYDYYRDRTDDTVGLAKTASLIAAAREEVPNALLFDNGDVIQGSPLGDYMAYSHGLKAGQVHPIIAAMNELDYVCGTLGNHEFNYGLDYLGVSLAGQNFPSVCANALKPDGTTLLPPFRVFTREMADEAGRKHSLRVGVIGFVPPQIVQWDQANLNGRLTTIDIVEAARQHLPKLRAESDVVVALCHSGIAGGEPKAGAENAALYLAQVPGIDAILTGHQHLVFPGGDFANIPGVDARRGTLHGVPAVMAGFWGSHLGIIDLLLERQGNAWKVTGHSAEARPIYERTPDRRIVSKADAAAVVLTAARAEHEATLAYVRQPVGETKGSINSYWALVADDPSVQIVSNAQTWYVKELARNAGLGHLPLLSAAAPFKAGGRGGPGYFTEVKPGPIAIKDVADIYLYPNTLRVVKVTGAQVREWLERSAGLFNQIDPASRAEQELINGGFPSYNFDVIDGVSYRIDVTQPSRYDNDGKMVAPEAHRIRDLTFDGRLIQTEREFLVVTNNYRAGGGGNFPGADGKTIVMEAPDLNRDVVVRYIVGQRSIDPTADGNWSLTPWPKDAVVSFVTGPGATAFRPAGLSVEEMGHTPEGFTKYRLGHAG